MAAPAPVKERPKETSSFEERVRRRAYELYLRRGNQPGSALDDWLQAEKEIRRIEEAIDERGPNPLTPVVAGVVIERRWLALVHGPRTARGVRGVLAETPRRASAHSRAPTFHLVFTKRKLRMRIHNTDPRGRKESGKFFPFPPGVWEYTSPPFGWSLRPAITLFPDREMFSMGHAAGLACLAVRESGCPQRKPFMTTPCSERDRLREAYFQATLEACRLSDALESLPFGLEFRATLDKAEDAHLACLAALRAYEDHCAAHGCEAEFDRPLCSVASGSFAYPCPACLWRFSVAATFNRADALMQRDRALDLASMACLSSPREYDAEE